MNWRNWLGALILFFLFATALLYYPLGLIEALQAVVFALVLTAMICLALYLLTYEEKKEDKQ